MGTYLDNIGFGVLTFPILAFLLSLPYAIFQYRRYGAVSIWKTTMVFMFAFYLLCMYYLVILPLPADTTAVVPSAATPQLQPFRGWQRIFQETGLVLTDPSTWLGCLTSHLTYSKLFNFLMTMPLGMFLGYFCKRNWKQVLLIGFATSLFLELTQLSGLYGIYEHPYRLFDVDDLLDNTTGAMLGYWVILPIRRMLPDLDAINLHSAGIEKVRTSAPRRLAAFTIDMLVTGIINLAVLGIVYLIAGTFQLGSVGTLLNDIVVTGLLFVVSPALTGGQTLGHRLLELKVVRPDGSPAERWRIALRYALLFWGFMLIPNAIVYFAPDQITAGVSSADVAILVYVYYIFWWISLLVRAIASHFGHPVIMLNGIATDTRVMSLAQIEAMRSADRGSSSSD